MPVAIITGCDTESGIGQAVCRELAGRGWTVYATGLKAENMDALKAKFPANIRTEVMDVTNEKQVSDVIAKIASSAPGGRLDLLVNNAGVWALAPTVEVDLGVARRLFDVTFWGTWAAAQAAGRVMAAQRGGTIVNIGSMAGRAGAPFMTAYCCAKGAVEDLTHALRCELHPFGVRVLYVAPAWVGTAIAANAHVPPRADWERGLYGAAYDKTYYQGQSPARQTRWTAKRMARVIVDAAVARRPPTNVYGGGDLLTYRVLLGLAPRALVDWVFTQLYGLADVAAAVRRQDKEAAQQRAAGGQRPVGGGGAGAAPMLLPYDTSSIAVVS